VVARGRVVVFASTLKFERWLAKQPVGNKSPRLKLAKKAAGVLSVAKQDVIAVALCHTEAVSPFLRRLPFERHPKKSTSARRAPVVFRALSNHREGHYGPYTSIPKI